MGHLAEGRAENISKDSLERNSIRKWLDVDDGEDSEE